MKPRVLCIGELIVDLCANNRDVPLVDVESFLRLSGGAPANVAVGSSRLGCFSALIGSVGSDFFGGYLLRELERDRVETLHVAVSSAARTTLAFIADHSDGRKEVEFYRHPGADMLLSTAQVDESYVAQFDIVHFGSVSLMEDGPRRATIRARDLAVRRGALTSCDVNWRPSLWPDREFARKQILAATEGVSVVKMSNEEWADVNGTSDFQEPARRLLDSGTQLIVRTDGASPARVATVRQHLQVPAFDVACIDSLGAGDAFMAALIARMTQDRLTPDDIGHLSEGDLNGLIHFAHAVAALTIQGRGAITALPTRAQADAFIAAHTR